MRAPPQILAFLAFAIGGAVVACRSPAPQEPPQVVPEAQGLLAQVIQKEPSAEGGLSSSRSSSRFVAQVPAGSIGPHLTLLDSSQLVVWATPSGANSEFYAVSLENNGEAGSPVLVGAVAGDVRAMSVGRRGAHDVAIAAVRRSGESDVLEVLYLGEAGQLKGGPFSVARSPGSILWVQLEPTSSGGLLFWAERRGEGASLFVSNLGKKYSKTGTIVVRDASSWQIARHGSHVSLVSAEGEINKSIQLRIFGEQAEQIGPQHQIATGIHGALDLDVAASGDGLMIAWTQRDEFHSRLYHAVVGAEGEVTHAAATSTHPRGEQALVRLLALPSSEEIFALWEEPLSDPVGRRTLRVGRFDAAKNRFTAKHLLQIAGDDPLLPSFAVAEGRVAMLLQSSICQRTDSAGQCIEDRIERVAHNAMVEPDGNWRPSLAQQIRLADDESAKMAWSLSCGAAGCFALAANGSSPASVYLNEVQKLDSSAGATSPLAEEATPSLEEIRVVAPIPELASLTGHLLRDPSGASELLYWLSYFDPNLPYLTPKKPAPDGRRAPVRAQLQTASIKVDEAEGTLDLKSTVISYRARSLGGAALVEPVDGEGLLAWSALDNGVPQLFVTLIDKEGKRIQQKMLTRTPGEVTDIAATRVERGYVLSWVDGRSGRPEIYAMFVGVGLKMLSREARVSAQSRAPSSLTLAPYQEKVALLWADVGDESRGDGSAIYGTFLDPQNGQPQAPIQAVVRTTARSHSPQLNVTVDESNVASIRCAWVESSPEVELHVEVTGSRLNWATLDDELNIDELASTIALPGELVDYSYNCVAQRCRAAVTARSMASDGSVRGDIWGIDWSDTGEVRAKQILPLITSRVSGASPHLVGDAIYFADTPRASQRWFLKRAQVDWGQ